MTDFSLANMDYAPVKFMIKVFEANYPESLGVVLVHKAPWIFQSIWKIIKGWLDPVVAAKVHFTKNLEDLEEFVPRDHIGKDMGGDDPWHYAYVESKPEVEDRLILAPESGDKETRARLEAERKAAVEEYERLTRQWIHDPKQEGIAAKREQLAEQLRSGYWELDPYVRARTLYDRTGVIRPGGQIQFYPVTETEVNGTVSKPTETVSKPTENGQTATHNGPLPAEHRSDDVD